MKLVYVFGVLIAAVGVFLSLLPSESLSRCPVALRQAATAYLPAALRSTPPLSWLLQSLDSNAAYTSDGMRLYSLQELAAYDGSDEALPILLGVNGDVFDVTEKGKMFYGKGMSYNIFAGKDSTRALSTGQFSDAENTDCSDFTESQMKALKEQHDFYLGKYPRVGKLEKSWV